MNTIWSFRLATLEFGLLCALALVLPNLEAPKNLFVALLVVTWIAHRIVARDVAWRRPDAIETALLLLLASTALSTALNWPFPNELKGLKDVGFQCVVFWIVYSALRDESRQVRLAAMIAIGTVVGLAWGAGEVLTNQEARLQFHSAGTVTQSAIYLGTAFVTSLAIAARIDLDAPGRSRQLLWWAGAALMMAGLFLMGSRGPLAATILASFALSLAVGRRGVTFGLIGLVVASIGLTAGLSTQFDREGALNKTRALLSGELAQADRDRFENWRIAFAHLKRGEDLVFGIGPRNFGSIDYRAMTFEPPLAIAPKSLNHAHNLFLTKLVEEGIVGLLALVGFFALVVFTLARDALGRDRLRWQWFAAFGAIAVPVVAGTVNTPWYQEHALLAMMLLGMYFAARRRAAEPRAANDPRCGHASSSYSTGRS